MPRFEGGTSLTTSPPILSVAAGDVLEARDQAQQRRLAAARRADEDDELARLDVEVDALDDVDVAERLVDVGELDFGHLDDP